MRDDEVEMLFGAMLNCEARGDYRTMRGHVKWSGPDIVEKGDDTIVREFARLLMRVIRAIDEEAKLGEGALLNLNHPNNIEWPKFKEFALTFVSPDHTGSLFE